MSSKHKPIYAYCVYHVAIVPKRSSQKLYAGMSCPLRCCVEEAAGKIEGVKIGRVETASDFMYVNLFTTKKLSKC